MIPKSGSGSGFYTPKASLNVFLMMFRTKIYESIQKGYANTGVLKDDSPSGICRVHMALDKDHLLFEQFGSKK